ncbi:MAG: CerR family C-terminal domain-containing protein [Sedimentisphaerales bacterium]
MRTRKDGTDTRNKLLKAASEAFAEKGYRDTTVAEICRRAGSNVAAVNYHFRGKDALYALVWRNAFEEALRVYPPDGGLPHEAPPEERLRALIYSLLHRIMDDGRLGYAGQILLQEMSNPTDVIQQVRHDMIRSLREHTRQVITELLGPDADNRQIGLCQMSVIHQCLAIGFRKGKLPPYILEGRPTPEFIDALVEHITRFSLAGIKAIRKENEAGRA